MRGILICTLKKAYETSRLRLFQSAQWMFALKHTDEWGEMSNEPRLEVQEKST
jgi:hypothetical protein